MVRYVQLRTLQNTCIREFSEKFEGTVNTEANTSNNMELFLFVL